MCVIVHKPKGSTWDEESLINCADRNGDGIGMAYRHEGRVIIHKGFMGKNGLDDAWEAISELPMECQEDEMMLHFRIGTHGHKDQGNCHPFPLCNDYAIMRALQCKCNMAIAHNGILRIEPDDKTVSDTMAFIKHCMYPNIGMIKEKPDILMDIAIESCRMMIMTKDNTFRWGKWEEHKGCWYSNSGYKSYKVQHYGKGSSVGFSGAGYPAAGEHFQFGYNGAEDERDWNDRSFALQSGAGNYQENCANCKYQSTPCTNEPCSTCLKARPAGSTEWVASKFESKFDRPRGDAPINPIFLCNNCKYRLADIKDPSSKCKACFPLSSRPNFKRDKHLAKQHNKPRLRLYANA